MQLKSSMPKIISVVLILITIFTFSCATFKKHIDPPSSYNVKINQFVFFRGVNPKYDIYIEDSLCSIHLINKIHRKKQIIYDTVFIGCYPLEKNDATFLDSIVDHLWEIQDTVFSSPMMDANLNVLYFMKNGARKTITISGRSVGTVDSLFDVVNVYCKEANIPILQKTSY